VFVCGWFWVVWVPRSRVVGFALMFFPVSLLTKDRRWEGVVSEFCHLLILAMRLVHRRSFLLSRTFFTRYQANRLVHRRSLLLSRAFSAMKYSAMRLVHRRSFLLSRAFITVNTQPRA